MLDALLDDPINRVLLDRYQRDFPLMAAPYAAIGDDLGLDEEEVIRRFDVLKQAGAISRIGAVIAGARTINMSIAALAGFSVPVVLKRMQIDPALAGGVVLTTITDVIGYMSFLGLGALFLL